MKPIFFQRIFLFLTFFLVFSCKSPQEKQGEVLAKIPDPKTLNETFVSDPDQILSPSTVNSLNQTLKELDISGKAHIDVVLVNSIGDEVPKDIAYKLFNTWKIGRADTNNGLLIFLVLDQRRVEFETGVGLEPVLTDMICGDIQRKYMIPHLKEENYDQAILSAIPPIIKVLNTENYNFNEEDTENYNVYNSESDEAVSTDNHSNRNQHKALFQLPKQHSYSFIDFFSNNDLFLLKTIPIILFIIVISIFSINVINKKETGCLSLVFAFIGIMFSVFSSFIIMCYIIAAKYNLIELLYLALVFYFLTGILFHLKYSRILYSKPKKDRYENYCYLDKYKRGLKRCLWFFPVSFIYFLYRKLCKDMEWYRYEPYTCRKCHNPMTLEEDKKLSEGKIKEEELKSVSYDVWICTSCNLKKETRYPNKRSKVKECKKCHFITSVFKEKVVTKKATTRSSGYGYEIYVCEFCHQENKKRYTIPKKSSSSSSSSSSGGSSSGGGFSSSSGGRSGGGGAGSSW